MNRLKLTLFILLFALSSLPFSAQVPEKSAADSGHDAHEYVFRFVSDKDMFFVPWSDNGKKLDSLVAAVMRHRNAIESGQMYILVSGYGTSGNDAVSAREMAHLRRSRVKSELIVRCGIREEHFITGKSFSEPYGERRNVVVVTLPASVEQVAGIAGAEAAARVEAYNREISGEAERERRAAEHEAAEKASREKAEAERAAAEQAERERMAAAQEQATEQTTVQTGTQPEVTAKTKPYTLALRANLLRWATLTPDLGLEWRINRHVGVLVNGSYTSWSWNDKNRRYALWEVAPEVRYYIGKEKRGYIGAMYKAGAFNYKLSATGKQGDLMGGGITGGYQLQLNKALSLDFNLGLGYIHADYEKYNVIDGVRVRNGKETKNWWGPVSAGVTLTWNIF